MGNAIIVGARAATARARDGYRTRTSACYGVIDQHTQIVTRSGAAAARAGDVDGATAGDRSAIDDACAPSPLVVLADRTTGIAHKTEVAARHTGTGA